MQRYKYLSHQEVIDAARDAAIKIDAAGVFQYKNIHLYGVPRGGIPAAYLVKDALCKWFDHDVYIAQTVDGCDFIIDDLYDSGATKQRYAEEFPDKRFLTLFHKHSGDPWLVFPWEGTEPEQSAEDIPLRLLQFIGEDPTRGGLVETPARFLKAWRSWTSGYGQKPEDVLKVFEDGAEKCEELILQRNIPIYSHCEHHLAPFFGVAHVAYIPNGKIVGLSKMNRLVEIFARRLQVQERLTNQIADAMQEHLKPQGVGVVLECRHMCMESRGVCQQGTSTVTSALRGAIKSEHEARNEFMRLIGG